jgi:ABC-type phosphate/phosphonate transport system substrate-binding protein
VIASLPMYDWPEIRPATDAVWASLRDRLRARGIEAPDALERNRPRHAQWRDPDLLLSQTCGYPYTTALRGTARIVATPVYEAEGCVGPTYRSAIVVRADDPAMRLAALRGRIAAFNAPDSQSGYSAFRAAITPLADNGRFFGATIETGSHLNAMIAVADEKADCASIDCVCWALAGRCHREIAMQLRVIAWSEPAPALPFITSARRTDEEVQSLREALVEVLTDPATAEARRATLLKGVEVLDDGAYDAIVAMEQIAVSAGYPVLA